MGPAGFFVFFLGEGGNQLPPRAPITGFVISYLSYILLTFMSVQFVNVHFFFQVDENWRMSEMNASYGICQSYPRLLYVPTGVEVGC